MGSENEERQRLREKMAAEKHMIQEALTALAGVVSPSESDRPGTPPAGNGYDPLLAACQMVGEAAGVTIRPPGERHSTADDQAAVDEIVRASWVRIREVILKDQWQRGDHGPLLAFAGEGHPVALLPAGARKYRLVDPVERRAVEVTPDVAESVAPYGYTFYRPLPGRSLGGWDLFRFGLFGSRNDLLAMIAMGVLVGLLGLVTPLAVDLIFSSIIPNLHRTQLLEIGAALLVSALAMAAFRVTQSIALLRLETRMDSSLQAAVWDRLLSLPVPFFRDHVAGDLGQRVMGISAIRQTLSATVTSSLLAAIFSVFSLALLFYYHAGLALIAVLLVVIFALVTAVLAARQVRRYRALSEQEGQLSGLILQFIRGVAKFRVAGAEGRAWAQWARHFAAQKRVEMEIGRLANGLEVWQDVYPVATMIILFAAVVLLGDTSLSTGQYLAFAAAFAQLLAAALVVSEGVADLLGVLPLYERARPILQTLPETDASKEHPGRLTGAIEVSHLSFRYTTDGPLVLNDVSLTIRQGEWVALVGPSGSGKSTLLRLLLGFERAEAGAVFYDGQDLATLDVREVRRQIGVVLQDGQLMTNDIYRNIVGSAPLPVEAAWEAARLAGIASDIQQMPMGMYTMVSEGGSTFSGGQRQRLLIARALVHQPRLLFLDEATSALDNQTQATVSTSLAGLEVTRVVVAHRLSTVREADRIYVLEHGRIVQQGRFEELVQQAGLFAELVARQEV